MSSFTVLIVPEDLSDEAVEALAGAMGVPAVCRGVPPRLSELLSAEDLPTVYTESAEEINTEYGVGETREMDFDDSEIVGELAAVVAALESPAEPEVE